MLYIDQALLVDSCSSALNSRPSCLDSIYKILVERSFLSPSGEKDCAPIVGHPSNEASTWPTEASSSFGDERFGRVGGHPNSLR